MAAPNMQRLKLLNLERWHAHVDARAAAAGTAGTAGGGGGALDLAQRVAPTAGLLFNRANPRNDGKFVQPYNRKTDEQEPMRGHQSWFSPRDYRRVDRPTSAAEWQRTRQAVPQYGGDFTSVPVTSVHKYRVPVTSVVKKEGDLKLFCCCGYRPTAAEWIWCEFKHLNLTHYLMQDQAHSSYLDHTPLHLCTLRALLQVPQPRVLPRALGHDLRHALLCLLPARAQLAHGDGARHDPHLPHPHRAHAVHARQQHEQVVVGLEERLARQGRAQLGPLPLRQFHAIELCVAHHRLLRHLRPLPPVGARLRRLRANLVLLLATDGRRILLLALGRGAVHHRPALFKPSTRSRAHCSLRSTPFLPASWQWRSASP